MVPILSERKVYLSIYYNVLQKKSVCQPPFVGEAELLENSPDDEALQQNFEPSWKFPKSTVEAVKLNAGVGRAGVRIALGVEQSYKMSAPSWKLDCQCPDRCDVTITTTPEGGKHWPS